MNQEFTTATLLKTGLMIGVKKGWRGFLWMIKIVLPVSLLTTFPASQHPEWQQTYPFLSILDEVHTIEAPDQNAGPFLFLCEKMS